MELLAFLGTGSQESAGSNDGIMFLFIGAVIIVALFVFNNFAKKRFTAPWQRALRIVLLTIGLLATGLFLLVIMWLGGAF